jgi:HEAT repeat protein
MPEAAAMPVAATFAVLAQAETAQALEALEAALDVPRPNIQLAAAEILLKRPASQGRLAVFRRIEDLPPAVQSLVHRSGSTLSTTFRQLMLQGTLETRAISLRAVRVSRQYQQLPNVIDLMNQSQGEIAEAAVDTLRSLIASLYDQWQSGVDGTVDSRIDGYRLQVLGDLQKAVSLWDAQSRPDELIEGILALAEPGHAAVKQVLWHGSPPCREIAAQRILESRHPGVMRLTAESLLESYPHPKVFLAIRTRHDPEFLAALLTAFGRKRSSRQIENLKQLQTLDWLVPPYDVLESIPPALQAALVEFVNATRISREIKAGVQEWMLRYGSPEGKRAATTGLSLVEEEIIQEVVRESLDSGDAEVQAWATTQLRQLALPETFTMLIERLGSPWPEVQAAARSELSGFSVPRVLAMADELPLDDALRSGILLMKVDPDAPAKIRRALAHPVRQKRIQAARQVARLGLQAQFVSAFAAMTEDTDAFVRRTAAQILATIPQMEAYRALSQLQNDTHPRVRETVEEALQRWNQEAGETDTRESDLAAINSITLEDW